MNNLEDFYVDAAKTVYIYSRIEKRCWSDKTFSSFFEKKKEERRKIKRKEKKQEKVWFIFFFFFFFEKSF